MTRPQGPSPLPRATTAAGPDGTTLVCATRRAFPLVSLRLVFRGGASGDPAGKEGLTALTVRMLERGTKNHSREALAERIETIGGSFHAAATMESARLEGVVLTRSLDEYAGLMAEMVREPVFDAGEFERLKGEMLSEIMLAREEDRDIGDAYFRRAVHRELPYGRFVDGTQAGLKSIGREDVIARWRAGFTGANLVVAGSGDVDLEQLGGLVRRHFGGMEQGTAMPLPDSGARVPEHGIEVLLVDKPERTQTQIFLGRTGLSSSDPDYIPFALANHGFGGMFTARVMQEVRVKRGWSYGASSRLEINRGRGLSGLWTFPSNEDTIPCVRLLLDLLKEFSEKGVSEEELEAARGHLLNTLAFELETPDQLVQRRIHELLVGLPDDWTERFVGGIEKTTLAEANAATARAVRLEGLVLVIVCTADRFVAELEAMPEVRRLYTVPFDAEDPSEWRLVLER